MCKICGWLIEDGVLYAAKNFLTDENGRQNLTNIALNHFVGRQVATMHKYYCGITKVASIKWAADSTEIFTMIDQNGCEDYFFASFDFEIIEDPNAETH